MGNDSLDDEVFLMGPGATDKSFQYGRIVWHGAVLVLRRNAMMIVVFVEICPGLLGNIPEKVEAEV